MSNYESQLERIKRYYKRFKNINNGRPHTDSTDYYMDDIFSFFINCYHLKDWLINDPSYTKRKKSEIEKYITKTESLSICADICNGLKHLKLGN